MRRLWCSRKNWGISEFRCLRMSPGGHSVNLERPSQLNKGYQFHSSVPSRGGGSPNQASKQRRQTGQSIMFCPVFAKNKHIPNRWLQLSERRSSIMWSLKERPADYGHCEPCVHAGTITKHVAKGWLITNSADQLRVHIKGLFEMSLDRVCLSVRITLRLRVG